MAEVSGVIRMVRMVNKQTREEIKVNPDDPNDVFWTLDKRLWRETEGVGVVGVVGVAGAGGVVGAGVAGVGAPGVAPGVVPGAVLLAVTVQDTGEKLLVSVRRWEELANPNLLLMVRRG